jgi:hypothetical protein
LFEDERQERDFTVRGGLLWFHHVLVAAVEVDKTFQVCPPLQDRRAGLCRVADDSYDSTPET